MSPEPEKNVKYTIAAVIALTLVAVGIGLFSFEVHQGDYDGDGYVTQTDALLLFCQKESPPRCPINIASAPEGFLPAVLSQELGDFPLQFVSPRRTKAFRPVTLPRPVLQGNEAIITHGLSTILDEKSGELLSKAKRRSRGKAGILIVDRGRYAMDSGSMIVSEAFLLDLGSERSKSMPIDSVVGIDRPVILASVSAISPDQVPARLSVKKEAATFLLTVRRRCTKDCSNGIYRVSWVAVPRDALIETSSGSLSILSPKKLSQKRRGARFPIRSLAKSKLQVITREPFLLLPGRRLFLEPLPES